MLLQGSKEESMGVKYVFVTGGVVSGLGKGITAASLGRLLKARGYHVTMQKLDPYINVDPGTMNPIQHGEVFVTDDPTLQRVKFTGRFCTRNVMEITAAVPYRSFLILQTKSNRNFTGRSPRRKIPFLL